MFWKKRTPTEKLPWYRRRNYKGDLTEQDKVELDSFRLAAMKPGGVCRATDVSELPDDVLSYIAKLEIELHDSLGSSIFGRALAYAVVGAFIVASSLGWTPKYESQIWPWFGVLLIVLAIVYYFWEEKRLRDSGVLLDTQE